MPYGRACTVSLFGGRRVPRPGRRAATVDEERGVGEGRDGTGRHRGAHSQSTLYTAASLTGARVDILGACVARGLSVSPVAKITIDGRRVFLSDACPFVQALSLCCPCAVLALSCRVMLRCAVGLAPVVPRPADTALHYARLCNYVLVDIIPGGDHQTHSLQQWTKHPSKWHVTHAKETRRERTASQNHNTNISTRASI